MLLRLDRNFRAIFFDRALVLVCEVGIILLSLDFDGVVILHMVQIVNNKQFYLGYHHIVLLLLDIVM